MATSEPLDPFLRQPSHTPSSTLQLGAPYIMPSNASALESHYPSQQQYQFSTHRSMSPVATLSSVSSTSLALSPTLSDTHQLSNNNQNNTPFVASVLASRQLPLPVPQRRQTAPLMSQKTLSPSQEQLPPLTDLQKSTRHSIAPLRAWPPTRSFSHDVAASTTADTAAAQHQKQLATQLQYLHQLDKMHRQRIRDIQRLHEQQQLFTSPHHRLSRRHKPAVATSRPTLFSEQGSPSHESSYVQQQLQSQLHHEQQQQQQQPHRPLTLSSSQNNNNVIARGEGNSMVAQPTPTQPTVAPGAWSEEQQHQPPPQDHYVRRFQLAQRMLQIQQMLHTQRIQQLHYMHKLNKTQQQHQQHQQHQHQQPLPELKVSKPSTIATNTTPTSPASPTTIVGADGMQSENNNPNHFAASSTKIPDARIALDISCITLPSVDTIRKQRRLRLKAQARLRQTIAKRKATVEATAEDNNANNNKHDGSDDHSATVKEEATSTTGNNTLVGSVTSGRALSDKGDDKSTALFSSAAPAPQLSMLPLSTAQLRQNINIIKKRNNSGDGDAALRLSDCSISRARLKSSAELAYKKQLVRQQSLQHHMIQDHTNRYRIYQAYCLLQRAREAQAMDELKAIELKQAQTRAWVENLRSQVDLEVPK